MLVLALSGLAASLPLSARADDDDGDGDDDRDDALRSVRAGHAKPLSAILPVIRERWPGELVGVKVRRRRHRLYYAIRVVAENGHLIEIEVDATSGTVIEVENE
ncbi:PepSY domain-containing protein [Rhizobium sp. PAMB 3182]